MDTLAAKSTVGTLQYCRFIAVSHPPIKVGAAEEIDRKGIANY